MNRGARAPWSDGRKWKVAGMYPHTSLLLTCETQNKSNT